MLLTMLYYCDPGGCSVASVIKSSFDISGPRARCYVQTHTSRHAHRHWAGHKTGRALPSSFPTCEPTCVSICRVEMPVVLGRSQRVSSTIANPPSTSLSALCPYQQGIFYKAGIEVGCRTRTIVLTTELCLFMSSAVTIRDSSQTEMCEKKPNTNIVSCYYRNLAKEAMILVFYIIKGDRHPLIEPT